MHHHSGHGLGFAVLVGLIAFAFGAKVARVIVGATLILGLLAFLEVLFLVVTDRI